jgi:hypothetical protein
MRALLSRWDSSRFARPATSKRSVLFASRVAAGFSAFVRLPPNPLNPPLSTSK